MGPGGEESVGFAGVSDESLSLPTRCAHGSWWNRRAVSERWLVHYELSRFF